MVTPEEDLELRAASMNWLERRTRDGHIPIDIGALMNDFYFNGVRRPLKNRQMGIHPSRGFGAAWTITTTFSEDKARRPYDDEPGPDGMLRYKWEKDDGENSSNRALRKAMDLHLPLVWFWGVATGLYMAVFPVYLVAEERSRRQFIVSTDGLQDFRLAGTADGDLVKKYRLGVARSRIHQPVFRERVLRAYDMQCAICRMPRLELLDAAHIIPDKEPDGLATVPNGLALCKIHHAAYDNNLIGVSGDGVLATRRDVLEATDGPVYEYGLKGIHGQKINVPKKRALCPDEALLAQRFEVFLQSQDDRPLRSDFAREVPPVVGEGMRWGDFGEPVGAANPAES